MKTFTLNTEYVEMNKLMKLLQLTETGGQAKIAISQGLVLVNGETELRLRRKLRKGDKVDFDGVEVEIV
ncbi:MAG: RNA-binding S4 domain-containing protein [Candidatus Gracilibacteria bacterium]|nr:RNA-binding S4 domain-containing protein [Candidatus Gracilibacteria bacterium]